MGKKCRKWRGHYWVYVRNLDGTERRTHKTVTLGPKAGMKKWEAAKALQAVIEHQTGGNAKPSPAHTLAWFFEHRYWPISGPQQKLSSRAGVEFFIRRYVIAPFGEQALGTLDRFELQTHAVKLAETFSYSVVSKFRVYVKAILDEAVEQGFLERNPARKLAVPVTRKPNRAMLSVDEVAALLAELNARDRLIVRMFVVLGLRPGELFGLRRDDVTASQVRVDETTKDGAVYEPKTTASAASVWLPDTMAAEIAAWMHGMVDKRPTAFLFVSQTGTPLLAHSYIRNVLQPAAERARAATGNPEGFLTRVNHQVFRRTCATLMQHEGTVKDIQAHLRHANPNVTAAVYMQAIPASVREAVERMERRLFGGHDTDKRNRHPVGCGDTDGYEVSGL